MKVLVRGVQVLESGIREFTNQNGEVVRFGLLVLSSINDKGYQETIRATCSEQNASGLPALLSTVDCVLDWYQPRQGNPKFRFVSSEPSNVASEVFLG